MRHRGGCVPKHLRSATWLLFTLGGRRPSSFCSGDFVGGDSNSWSNVAARLVLVVFRGHAAGKAVRHHENQRAKWAISSIVGVLLLSVAGGQPFLAVGKPTPTGDGWPSMLQNIGSPRRHVILEKKSDDGRGTRIRRCYWLGLRGSRRSDRRTKTPTQANQP